MSKRKLYTDDMYEIADLLGVTVTYDRERLQNPLSGDSQFEWLLADGLSFVTHVKILDSAVYTAQGMVWVALHICGCLYGILCISPFSGDEWDRCRLWLVNRAGVLGRTWSVFPAQWSEDAMQRVLQEGVVGQYRCRGGTHKRWVRVPQQERSVLVGLTEAPLSAPSESDALNQISDKFRTKGPRDL